MAAPGLVADALGTVSKRKRSPEPRASKQRDANDVALRVRHFREAADMTQETLARHAGVTAKFVSQIENGHVNPSVDVMTRLVEDGLGLPLSAFFAADSIGTREDLAQIAALLGAQPAAVRKRALRVVKALCDE